MKQKTVKQLREKAEKLRVYEKCLDVVKTLGTVTQDELGHNVWTFIDPDTDYAIVTIPRGCGQLAVRDRHDKLLYHYCVSHHEHRIQAFVDGKWLDWLEDLVRVVEARRKEEQRKKDIEERKRFGLPATRARRGEDT